MEPPFLGRPTLCRNCPSGGSPTLTLSHRLGERREESFIFVSLSLGQKHDILNWHSKSFTLWFHSTFLAHYSFCHFRFQTNWTIPSTLKGLLPQLIYKPEPMPRVCSFSLLGSCLLRINPAVPCR